LVWDAARLSFFDPLPPPPEPPEPDHRSPEWAQPPDNVMPAAVALDSLIVARGGVAA
jgi:hypothetical protein